MRKILVIISIFYDHHKRRYSAITFFIPSAVFTIPEKLFWANFVANNILDYNFKYNIIIKNYYQNYCQNYYQNFSQVSQYKKIHKTKIIGRLKILALGSNFSKLSRSGIFRGARQKIFRELKFWSARVGSS